MKEVQSALPQFTLKGRLLILLPVGYLLRGICFDSSAFSKTAFYPTVFIQPLYIGDDHIVLSFDGRLRDQAGREGWELNVMERQSILNELVTAIKDQAFPFLNSICDPRALASICESKPGHFRWFRSGCDEIHQMETAAYSWLLAGETEKSIHCLERAQRTIDGRNDQREWVVAVKNRIHRMQKLLHVGDVEEACQVLREATRASALALGVSEYLQLG